MREPARLQAAIEIVDAVLQSVADGGAAADVLVQRYFATRRYAGARDRAAVRDLVFAAIRHSADPPATGRAALLGLAEARPELLPLFDGSLHAPAPVAADEPRAAAGLVPLWLEPAFAARFGAGWRDEAAALVGRAPLDLRVNRLKTDDIAAVAAELPGAAPIPGLAFGLRLQQPVALDRHPLWQDGIVEVQDAASQRCIAFAAPRPGDLVVDLCAGGGGKTLALAAEMAGRGTIIAADIDRRRLAALGPRLARAGAAAMVQTRLLDPMREAEALADLCGHADLVLVDAPCSGTGTWRRNPELRWRLAPERLRHHVAVQERLLDLGVGLVRPGGTLVYSVCSVLPGEGREQALRAEARHGLPPADTLELSPAADGCDGFFVARWRSR